MRSKSGIAKAGQGTRARLQGVRRTAQESRAFPDNPGLRYSLPARSTALPGVLPCASREKAGFSRMKRLQTWQIVVGVGSLALSAAIYLLHYLVFRDAHHIFMFLLGDLAFVFVEVLLVTIIIHELLRHHERQSLMQKLNMVIGAFFSEVGLAMLRMVHASGANATAISDTLALSDGWTPASFRTAFRELDSHDYSILIERVSLEVLNDLLTEKRDFLLRLMENPNLLENESFTNLLWAVFHLAEELRYRESLEGLSHGDAAHLAGDVKRAYALLTSEWLSYMRHLHRDYPYLFSLAVRTNPFSDSVCVEIA
jgi:hypothetical protein